jgi:hypothetical protein
VRDLRAPRLRPPARRLCPLLPLRQRCMSRKRPAGEARLWPRTKRRWSRPAPGRSGDSSETEFISSRVFLTAHPLQVQTASCRIYIGTPSNDAVRQIVRSPQRSREPGTKADREIAATVTVSKAKLHRLQLRSQHSSLNHQQIFPGIDDCVTLPNVEQLRSGASTMRHNGVSCHQTAILFRIV